MQDAREVICQKFCSYYKPTHFEDPGCGGYVVVTESLDVESKLASLCSIKKNEPPLFGIDENDPVLLEACSVCTYPPDGCDFRNPNVSRDSCSPCGGLQAVAGLMARKA
jgi:hypothetical protein